MKRKRRNHTPAFKARVALAAIRGDRTMAELSAQFDVHVNQIQQWRKQMMENAVEVFGKTNDSGNSEETIKELHAKIGQLTMERDFLEQGLERIHGPKGKR